MQIRASEMEYSHECNGKYCQRLFPYSISELFPKVLGMLQHEGCVYAKVLEPLSLQTESYLDTPLPSCLYIQTDLEAAYQGNLCSYQNIRPGYGGLLLGFLCRVSNR